MDLVCHWQEESAGPLVRFKMMLGVVLILLNMAGLVIEDLVVFIYIYTKMLLVSTESNHFIQRAPIFLLQER